MLHFHDCLVTICVFIMGEIMVFIIHAFCRYHMFLSATAKIEHKEAEVDPLESEAMGFIGGLMQRIQSLVIQRISLGVDVSNAEDRVIAIMNAAGSQAMYMSHFVDFPESITPHSRKYRTQTDINVISSI
eukprot:349164_1